MSKRHPILSLLLAALLVVGVACALSGCRDSLAFKHIEHSQDAEKIDYDSGVVLQVESPDGEVRNDVVTSQQEVQQDATQTEAQQATTEYNSQVDDQEPTSEYWHNDNDSNDSESSEAVTPDTNNGDSSSEDPQEGDQSSSGESQGDNPSGEGSESEGGVDPTKPGPVQVYDTWGENVDPPSVSSIAATGELAVIVQMLSGGYQDGATCLFAADAELLTGEFSNVFADEGASTITAAWTGDGSASGEVDIEALVAAKPDTVLVTNSAYFTEAQQDALSAAGISITIAPELTSVTRIKFAVNMVGKMLNSATGGLSSQRATQYASYHDSLVSQVKSGNEGNGLGSSATKTVYDADATGVPDYAYVSSLYTLIVDEWDYGVNYVGEGSSAGSVTTDGSGLGLFTAGYRRSPVSYYASVAGVVNNGAAINESVLTTKYTPLWQFSYQYYGNLSMVGWTDDRFNSDTILSHIDNGTGAVNNPLIMGTAQVGGGRSIQTGLGSDVFPYLIVTTQRMKSVMIANSSYERGAYHIYDGENSIGSFTAIKSGSSLDEVVLVNPHGLFSDWVGGSTESVLEAVWIANEYGNDAASVEDEIASFYATFYRYDLAPGDLEAILGGLAQ
jgi:ABC-type Fe3+-hydroxamate transport system substrate-binding protein